MGGRGSNSTVTAGGGGANNFSQFQLSQEPPQMAATQQQAQQQNNAAFNDTDNADYHALYNGAGYFQRQNLTPDQVMATYEYLRNDTGGQLNSVSNAGTAAQNATQSPLYTMSQNMNALMQYNHDHGLPMESGMNANQRYVMQGMISAMHNLGYNLNLTRYDHAPMVNKLLQQAGIRKNFQSMSAQDIAKALVGRTYNEGRPLSTSYNNFKDITDPRTRMTYINRAVRIEYKAKASTQAMMPGNGPGGRFGEMVLSPSTNCKIVGVRYDNSVKVRQQGTSYLSSQPQLVLVVETE